MNKSLSAAHNNTRLQTMNNNSSDDEMKWIFTNLPAANSDQSKSTVDTKVEEAIVNDKKRKKKKRKEQKKG